MAESNVTPTLHAQALQQGARSRGVELTVFGLKVRRRSHPRLMLRKHRVLRRHTQFELPSGATVTPRVPPRSMNCCTAPEALASSTNSLT